MHMINSSINCLILKNEHFCSKEFESMLRKMMSDKNQGARKQNLR